MTKRVMSASDALVGVDLAGGCADREAYLFGDLEAEASRAFEEHQRNCSTCQKEVAEYRLFTSALVLPQTTPARISESEHRRMMESVFRAASTEKIADESEKARPVVAPFWGSFFAFLSVFSPRSLAWGGWIVALVVGVIASLRFSQVKEAVVPRVSRAVSVSERTKPMTPRRALRQHKMAALRKNQTKEPQTPRTWSPPESFAIVVQTNRTKRREGEKPRQQGVYEIESLRVVVRFPKASDESVRVASYPRASSQADAFVFAGETVQLKPHESASQSLGVEVRMEDDPHAFFQLRQEERGARKAEKHAVSADSIKKSLEIPLIQRATPRAVGEETISSALLL